VAPVAVRGAAEPAPQPSESEDGISLMNITADAVKQLRERTGAGMMECKKALVETKGDLDAAAELMRKQGLAKADKKAARVAAEGVVVIAKSADGRTAAMVEINCETDFVARTEDFKALAHDVALQVAASDPRYVSREDVPEDVLAAERLAFLTKARSEGKDGPAAAAAVEQELARFYEAVCLLDQPFIREPARKVNERVQEVIARTGENIQVRRFARFKLGEP